MICSFMSVGVVVVAASSSVEAPAEEPTLSATQELDAEAGDQSPTPGVAVPEPPPAVMLDPTWQTYRDAFTAAVEGRMSEAEEILLQIAEESGDHPAASAAREVLDAMAQSSKPQEKRQALGIRFRTNTEPAGARIRKVTPDGAADRAGLVAGDVIIAVNGIPIANAKQLSRALEQAEESLRLGLSRGGEELSANIRSAPPGADPLGPEETTTLARAELAIFQTIHGIAFGVEMCAAIDCGDSRGVITALVLGGNAGLIGSLVTTRDGIRPGSALLMNSGVSWGVWNGFNLIQIKDINSPGATFATLMVSQLVGLGVGNFLRMKFEPKAGDVSLANSAGIWAAVITMFGDVAIRPRIGRRALWLSLAIASNAGLVGGAILSKHQPMTRSRVLIIDAGGILGMLVGMAVPFMIQSDFASEQLVFSAALVGTVAGLATATWMTSSWDIPNVPAQLTVIPTNGGAFASLGWRL